MDQRNPCSYIGHGGTGLEAWFTSWLTVWLVKLLRNRSVCFSFAGGLVSYVKIVRGQLLRDRHRVQKSEGRVAFLSLVPSTY